MRSQPLFCFTFGHQFGHFVFSPNLTATALGSPNNFTAELVLNGLRARACPYRDSHAIVHPPDLPAIAYTLLLRVMPFFRATASFYL
jgi:hypothetical protein